MRERLLRRWLDMEIVPRPPFHGVATLSRLATMRNRRRTPPEAPPPRRRGGCYFRRRE